MAGGSIGTVCIYCPRIQRVRSLAIVTDWALGQTLAGRGRGGVPDESHGFLIGPRYRQDGLQLAAGLHVFRKFPTRVQDIDDIRMFGVLDKVSLRRIRMTLLKKTFAGLLALFSVVFFWWTGMNYAGYCHKESRFLSDEEMINSAVQFILDRYPPSISKVIEVNKDGKIQKREYWYLPENPVKYKGIKEFIEINPSCCNLSMIAGDSGYPDFIDRITGNVATYVIVEYNVKYLEENEEKTQLDSTAVAIKNCGKSWSGL